MIAMQYQFCLPSDYDMSIIKKRIDDKGSLFDKEDQLLFKTFLYAEKDDPITKSKENLYAPFYVWKTSDGMTNFIKGNKFQSVLQSFGKPGIDSWPCIVAINIGKELLNAKYATKTINSISPYDISSMQWQYKENSNLAGYVIAIEPKNWTRVEYILWKNENWEIDYQQCYNIRHISYPDIDK
jgi:hypothetical protein